MLDDIKTIIRDHWNDRATGFDDSPNHVIADDGERAEWQRLFGSALGHSPQDLLDVGTGTGEVALLLAAMGHRVIGSDIAEDMLALARTKAAVRGLGAQFVYGDAEALPFPDASFDVVVNRHLLWTLPHPERALGEWVRVLRPGGKMVVVDGDWNMAAKFEPPPVPAADGGHRSSRDVYREYGIADHLPLQGVPRPQTDLAMLAALGLSAKAQMIGHGGDFFIDLPFGTRGANCRFVLFAGKPA